MEKIILKKDEMHLLNFTRFLDDLFDINLFYAYYFSHKENGSITNIIFSIEEIINCAIKISLNQEDINLIFEKYGLGKYTGSKDIRELSKQHKLDYSVINFKIMGIINKLRKDEYIVALKCSFFNISDNYTYFSKIAKFFDTDFIELYCMSLTRIRENELFKIWDIFEEYDLLYKKA